MDSTHCQWDVFRATAFKKCASRRRIMRIRRSKSPGVRRHGGTDENRMNVIQMKRQSVVETAIVREPTKDIPFDHVGIYGSHPFYFVAMYIALPLAPSRLLLAYFLFISRVSFIRFVVTFLSRFPSFPGWRQLCRSRNKNRRVIFNKFSDDLTIKNSPVCTIYKFGDRIA